MKSQHIIAAALLSVAFTAELGAQGTAFSYNGHLSANGSPATGLYDFRFILYNAEIGGSQAGVILTNAPVAVTNGVFTTTLDFGAGVFDGRALWLELAVRPSRGATPFDPLAPRQPMLPTPYAITASNLTGTLPAVQLSGALPSALLNGAYGNPVTFNNASNSFTGSGAGLTALNASNLATGIVPDARLSANVSLLGQTIESAEITDGTIVAADLNAASFGTAFWRASGNLGTDPLVNFLGTLDFQSLDLRVNNIRALRLQPHVSGSANLIGSYSGNAVAPGRGGATIAGGGTPGQANQVQHNFGTVSGGKGNAAGGEADTIGGGDRNRIGLGGFDNTIAGGLLNEVGTNTTASTIGGGWDNTIAAFSLHATIAGGFQNNIANNSSSSAIGGGRDNTIASNSPNANIAGGYQNDIGVNADFSAIGGGDDNNIGTNSTHSTIAGGSDNAIGVNAGFSVIGGGIVNNVASNSPYATIHPMPPSRAACSTTFKRTPVAVRSAEGSSTKSRPTHSIPPLPGGNGNFEVDAPGIVGGRFFISETNGNVGIGTNAPIEKLHVRGNILATGTITPNSDRNAKTGITPVDSIAIIERLATLPIHQWRFKAEPEEVKHVGPMAQDFREAFGLGAHETAIATVDADGVALAAIQGLNQKLEAELAEKNSRIANLEQRLKRLENLVSNHPKCVKKGSMP